MTLVYTCKQKLLSYWREYRWTICIFLFGIVPIKSSLADLNWVPTGSMNPTIVEGDMVVVNKAAYDFRVPLTLKSLKKVADPERGDIAILFSPNDKTRLVKRVIGVPGDTLEMRNKIMYLNGRQLTYNSLDENDYSDVSEQVRMYSKFAEEQIDGKKYSVMTLPFMNSDSGDFEKVFIPDGHYFVMGDNRDNSLDSRSYGLVERKLFVGKASRILVSFNVFEWFQPRLNRFLKKLN